VRVLGKDLSSPVRPNSRTCVAVTWPSKTNHCDESRHVD